MLRAIIVHVYIAWIHPFGDGNGRTARLVEFMILARANVPTPVAHLLSNHYNETRTEYYRHLKLSSASGGEILPFIVYAVQGLVDGMSGQIQDYIRQEHMRVTWESLVHQRFRERKRGEASSRQRDVALDLFNEFPNPVPKQRIPELTTRLAGRYASLTQRAVARDVNALREMKLIILHPEGYVVNRGLLLAAR